MTTNEMKIYVSGKSEVECIDAKAENGSLRLVEDLKMPSCEMYKFSKNGELMVFVDRQIGFSIKDTKRENEVVVEIMHVGIQAVAFSPLGSFLVTWERPSHPEGNLIVWEVKTGRIVARYSQKTYSKARWPCVQWSEDEAICGRMTNNEVHLYNGEKMEAGNIARIMEQGVTDFSVSPGVAPYSVAAFVPEKKGRPASVKLYRFPNVDVPVATKSFYKAQDVTLNWSPNGSALIVQTSTDLDTSGKSYYGETGLYFMQSDGKYDCIIPLTKEGPVHDVQWDPTGKGFIVMAGTMPCHSTLYDNKCRPSFEFGSAPRNCISWSPHGRFVCLAGFGNLAGDMDFWDRNKLVKLGSCNSNSSTCYSWSPDSRYFMTGTTFPRLRVENGFKVYKYNGVGPIVKEERTEIYEVQWRPAKEGDFPNRPASPKSSSSEAPTIVQEQAKPKPQAYRPPGRTSNLAAMMRREQGDSKKIDKTKFTPSAASGASRIPGLAPPVAAGPKKLSKSQRMKKKRDEMAATEAIQKATEEALNKQAANTTVELTEDEKRKKVKNLNKKLRQIESLKEKASNGETLNNDQKEKLAAEADIMAEIQALS